MMNGRELARALAALTAGAGAPGLLAACADTPDRGGSEGTDVPPAGIRLVSADVRRAPGDVGALPDTVSAMRSFAGRLYGDLAARPGNLALSPYSVAVALAMTANGAGGTTLQEMADVLGVDDLDRHNRGLNALTRSCGRLAGVKQRADGSEAALQLAAANQLFGQHDVAWTGAFLEVLAREYDAGMRTVDFARAAERARQLVNSWTVEQTRDRIPEILPPGVVDSATRLVLVNAVHLKAPWERPFEPGLTAPATFPTDQGPVRVRMMRGAPTAQVTEGDGWRAARLAYAGGELAMTIVLPDADRFGEVERALVEEGTAPSTRGAWTSAA